MKRVARYVAFVRHEHVNAWECLGWLNTGPLPGPHRLWSCGVEWICDCDVRRP
jgi:hypothetical protein